MSRAGKYPVKLIDGVVASIADDKLVIKGPKGELTVPMNTKNASLVEVKIEDGHVAVLAQDLVAAIEELDREDLFVDMSFKRSALECEIFASVFDRSVN